MKEPWKHKAKRHKSATYYRIHLREIPGQAKRREVDQQWPNAETTGLGVRAKGHGLH